MTLLSAREGYRLWAPTYADENVVTTLENGLVEAMTGPRAGKRLLDAGCGTGRRLRATGWASVTGVDLSPEMLEQARLTLSPDVRLLIGDVRALPLPDASADVSWCRLVIGHLDECRGAYAELARVTAAGGQVIVTDFHPMAHAAGHRRTFRLGDTVHELEHYVHDLPAHIGAAHATGLRLIDAREARIGAEVRSFYEHAGRDALYRAQIGLPMVLALGFERS